MTTIENRTIKDFVLADPENIATALAVYQSWPAIAAQIKRGFLELIYNKLPNGTKRKWHYIEKKESYICIYRKSWLPYGKERSCIYLGVQRYGNVYIGVRSISTHNVDKRDKERRQRLQDAFAKYCEEDQEVWLPWWEWIDKEYKNWNDILPELHQECRGDSGKITDYFVKKFKKVFDWAAPMIDDIDRH